MISLSRDFSESDAGKPASGFTGKTTMKGDFDHIYKRGRRKLHYHNLRKFFRTYFGNSDLAEHLMGHVGYLSTYRQFNDKQLAIEYLKHMENVTVFGRSPDLTGVHEQLNEMADENQKLKEDVNDLRIRLLEVDYKYVQEIKN